MDHMFEMHGYTMRRIISVILILLMALPAGSGASGPGHEGGAAPRVTDDSSDLMVPTGETYELYGCHTYSQSVQIEGTLNVRPYDGVDGSTGTLALWAKVITVGSSGMIVADGRGFGGGGGGTELFDTWSVQQAGYGGTGGNGGNGANSWGVYGGGGGGGSNGGLGGTGHTYGYPGTNGNATKGGDGGCCTFDASPYRLGGTGGTGFGGGGGGGAGDDWHAGGGGGGGSGGLSGVSNTGGNGAGPSGGAGGLGSGDTVQPPPGVNGGYNATAANGDNSTDLSISRGGGGGGGGSSLDDYAGGGGGGAGGACVSLISSGDLVMNGAITTTGAGGGKGGGDHSGAGGAGGGGAGGGVLLYGQKVSVTGSIDARGRAGDTLSTANGGTVKILYVNEKTVSPTIQAGRLYMNGPPRMQGLLSPEIDSINGLRPEFKWNDALDLDGDPVTYNIQVSTRIDFTNLVLNKTGITTTNHTSEKDLTVTPFYWRVRARDAIIYSLWSPVWKFLPDTTPPVSQVAVLPKYSTATNFTVSWSGTDGCTGITGYDIFVAEGNGSLNYAPWLQNTLKTSSIYQGKDGQKYSFFSVATDAAHNREADPDQSDAFCTVDITPPVTTMTPMPPYQGGLTFKLSWSSKDATSGVAYYNVFVAEGDGDFELYLEHATKTTAQFEADDGREYRFYTVACDNVGNWEAAPQVSKILKTRVDLTPPVVSLRLGTPNSGQDPVFVTAATPIYIDATDNFAGVNGTFYIIDDRGVKPYATMIKESAPGHHNLSYWSTDKAGNKGDIASLWFFVDAESPQTSLICEGPDRVSGDRIFVTASTSISLNAVDGGSGVNWMEYNLDKRGFVRYTAPLKYASGTHSLLYRSVDKVGNVEAEKSVTVIVDTTSPNTNPEGDYSTVSNTDLSITLAATDAESGVAGTFFKVVREKEKAGDYQAGNTVLIVANSDGSEDGNCTIQYYSVDNVNNVERVKELKVRIDTRVALQIGFTGEPSVSESSFLLEGKTEPGSKMTVGITEVQLSADGSFAQDISLKPGKNKVILTITDPAGNTLSKTVYITFNEPVTNTGWFLPLILVVVIAAAAGAGFFLYTRRSKGAAPSRKPVPKTARVREPPRWPEVPPPSP